MLNLRDIPPSHPKTPAENKLGARSQNNWAQNKPLEQVGWIKLDQVTVILDQVGSSSKKLETTDNFRLEQLPVKFLDQVGSTVGEIGSSWIKLDQVRWIKFQTATGHVGVAWGTS